MKKKNKKKKYVNRICLNLCLVFLISRFVYFQALSYFVIFTFFDYHPFWPGTRVIITGSERGSKGLAGLGLWDAFSRFCIRYIIYLQFTLRIIRLLTAGGTSLLAIHK